MKKFKWLLAPTVIGVLSAPMISVSCLGNQEKWIALQDFVDNLKEGRDYNFSISTDDLKKECKAIADEWTNNPEFKKKYAKDVLPPSARQLIDNPSATINPEPSEFTAEYLWIRGYIKIKSKNPKYRFDVLEVYDNGTLRNARARVGFKIVDVSDENYYQKINTNSSPINITNTRSYGSEHFHVDLTKIRENERTLLKLYDFNLKLNGFYEYDEH